MTVARGVVRPRFILDVYDKQAGDARVAQVESDGERGRTVVFEPALEGRVRKLLDLPQLVMRGVAGGGAPQELKPYTKESLEHAMQYGLPLHNLRGVLKTL